jgi:aminoglycoside/choline kinase family phosphotransferase
MNQTNAMPYHRLSSIARDALGEIGPVVVTPMLGGASTRQFARVGFPSGKTAVAMYVPEAHGSDEIVKQGGPQARWPFLEVRDLLAERGVRVPEILHEACSDGLLLVEDLGDRTLAVTLEQFPHLKTSLYQTAIADLVRAQHALAELPQDSIVRSRAFDQDLLRWEVDHFREWALEARNITLNSSQRDVFEHAAEFLANTIAGFTPSFVHRDYQSRNIMVRFDEQQSFELTWIDFQDALMGPRTYDLVALLGDSYQVFDKDFIDARLAEYSNLSGLVGSAQQRLRYEFDLVTVQRKLKDAGRFIYIDRVKKNTTFLGFVEPTIDKVMHALERLNDEPILGALGQLLRELRSP